MSPETANVLAFLFVFIGLFAAKFLFVGALMLAVVLPVAVVAFVGLQTWIVIRPVVIPVAMFAGMMVVVGTRLLIIAALGYGGWMLFWWWAAS